MLRIKKIDFLIHEIRTGYVGNGALQRALISSDSHDQYSPHTLPHGIPRLAMTTWKLCWHPTGEDGIERPALR